MAGDVAAVAAQAEEDDVCMSRRVAGSLLAMRNGALEDVQPGGQPLVERVGVKDHVGGEGDRDQSHQRNQAERFGGQVAEADTQRPQDQ